MPPWGVLLVSWLKTWKASESFYFLFFYFIVFVGYSKIANIQAHGTSLLHCSCHFITIISRRPLPFHIRGAIIRLRPFRVGEISHICHVRPICAICSTIHPSIRPIVWDGRDGIVFFNFKQQLLRIPCRWWGRDCCRLALMFVRLLNLY